MRLGGAVEVGRQDLGGGVVTEVLADGEVQERELVEQGRVGLLQVEGPLREAHLHHGPDLVLLAPLPVMLLNNLEEARVVEVAVFLELADLVRDLLKLALELLEPLDGDVALRLGVCGRRQILDPVEGGIDACPQFLDLFLLELGDLLELGVKNLVAEAVFVVLGPGLVVIVRLILVQERLELGIVDVLVLPRRIDRLPESLAEPHLGVEDDAFIGRVVPNRQRAERRIEYRSPSVGTREGGEIESCRVVRKIRRKNYAVPNMLKLALSGVRMEGRQESELLESLQLRA